MHRPPRVKNRRLDRPYICGTCGKNHPTSQCIPKNQGGIRPEPQMALWCDFHKRWENHSTENHFNQIQHMQEQALVNDTQVQMDRDKAIPILERQPPLPKTTLVRIVNQDEVYNDERALALVLPYSEDQTFIPDLWIFGPLARSDNEFS